MNKRKSNTGKSNTGKSNTGKSSTGKSSTSNKNKYVSSFIISDLNIELSDTLDFDIQFEKTPKLTFPNKEIENHMLDDLKFHSEVREAYKTWSMIKNLCSIHIYLKTNENIYYKYGFLNIYRLLSMFKFLDSNNVSNILAIDVTNDDSEESGLFYKKRLDMYIDAIQTYIVRKSNNTLNTYKINYLLADDLDNFDLDIIYKKINKWREHFDFIIITGTEEFFLLKEIRFFRELVNLPIFLFQIYILLYCQKKNGNAILYIDSTFQLQTKQLLYLLSTYYKNINVISHDDISMSNYVSVEGFKGIDDIELEKINQILQTIKSNYPHLGKNINIHSKTIRSKYGITKSIDKKTDIELFIKSFFTTKLPSIFLKKINSFEQKTTKRLMNKSLIFKHIETYLESENYTALTRIQESIKRYTRILFTELGLIYEDPLIVDTILAKYKEQLKQQKGGIIQNKNNKSNNSNTNKLIEYKDENTIFEYFIPSFQIRSDSIQVEIYRYILLETFKEHINKELKKNNIKITYSHVFPKWIMSQVKKNGDSDPVIPFSNKGFKLNNIQLIEDISNVGHVSMDKAELFVNSLRLKVLCSDMIDELLQLQKNESDISATIFEYNKNDVDYVKFHSSLDTGNNEIIDFIFSLTKSRYKSLFYKYKIQNNLGIDSTPGDDFHKNCFILILRYYTLESYNQQLAVAPRYYQYILDKYNTTTELFASSINTSLTHYCSLFSDIEYKFCSRGRFDSVRIKKGMYTANPPYSIDIMNIMVTNLLKSMDKSKYDIGVFIIIPAWDKDEHKYGIYKPLFDLKRCKYLVDYIKIYKKNAIFFDYFLNKKVTPCDVYIILLQNDKSKSKYKINLKVDVRNYWK